MSLEPHAASLLPVSLCCSTVCRSSLILPFHHWKQRRQCSKPTIAAKTVDLSHSYRLITAHYVAPMPRHTRRNPGPGPLYSADDLPRRTRTAQWQNARAPFNSRQALEAYIRQHRLNRYSYTYLRNTAKANGLALPLWNYKRGKPPQALSLFFNPDLLIARCGNQKSIPRVRNAVGNRYVTLAQAPVDWDPLCRNDQGLPTSLNHGAEFKECEGYKMGVDVGQFPHGPGFMVCTDCADEEAEHRDFTKWEPSTILPYCRDCCEGPQTGHFAFRNYRRHGGYGAPGVRICKCSEKAYALHLCSDCRTEWHNQAILRIAINARNRLHQYPRNGPHQGVLDPYVKDDLDPVHANMQNQERFLADRSWCPCGKGWRQVKTSWNNKTTKFKNEAMLRECLKCCRHVPAEDMPRWPDANDCSARFWNTEAPDQRLNRNYI